MHIIYLDESGTHSEARYFVVAGLAVFERNTFVLARSLDELQANYFPQITSAIEFHASSLRAPEGRVPEPFGLLTVGQRQELMAKIYQVIIESRASIFAVAMEKTAITENHYERGFEEITSRFDYMLSRIHRDRGEDQRGLIVVAESSYRENLEFLAKRIASEGHRWGGTHNIADIPYFAPAKSTRLLQLADFVSNAVFTRYEGGYTRDFDKIATHFDQDAGRIHGLVHLTRERHECYCPACVQRRLIPRPEPGQTRGDSSMDLS